MAQTTAAAPAATADWKANLLRLILAVAAIGHLVVGLSFWFFPERAIDEILAWGPASGWTSILGSYDLAVAAGLFLALRDPPGSRTFILFVGILLILHALTHAYYVVWGDAPDRHWFVVSYLLAGGVALLWLAPRPRPRGDDEPFTDAPSPERLAPR